MKKIITLALTLMTTFAFSQVIINPGSKTTVTTSSVSLEFGADVGGIILPYVDDAIADSQGAVAGTFVMDPVEKAIKYKTNNGGWIDLSGAAARTNAVSNVGFAAAEKADAKVIIGNPTSAEAAVNGVLVLSDSNKGMVLPQVANPHLAIVNPSAGLMVFDPENKMLAVFNGTHWSFWKP